jgi:hypothetical protein
MGDHLVLNHCDSTTIGQPIHFQAGDFAGRTIRAELREVQKADVGRKYGPLSIYHLTSLAHDGGLLQIRES